MGQNTMMKVLLILAVSLVACHASSYNMDHFMTPAVKDFVDSTEHLKAIINLAETDAESLAEMIQESPLAAIMPNVTVGPFKVNANASQLPVVVAHGMGDSCFNPGMKSATQAAGNHLGVYATCIPTANSHLMDTIDGFLKNMDASVDFFAKKIKADKSLANGFNCIGFSQGNSLCRGYIQKYNDPPVNAFVSVHGTVMGVSAFPGCFQQGKPLGIVCKALAEVLGDA